MRLHAVDGERQDVERKHTTAALCEGSRDCATDAAGGAGDNDAAIFEANLHG